MRKTAFLLITTFCYVCSYSQIKATTETGKNVLLQKNGTWEYIETSKPEDPSPSSTSETAPSTLKCSDIIETTFDKLTGESTTASKDFIKLGTEIDVIMLLGQKRSIVTVFYAKNAGCIDDDGKMLVLFRDGTRMEIKNQSKFNCEGKFTLYMGGPIGGPKEQFKNFTTKEIETIRINGSRSYPEHDLTSSESKILLTAFQCLSAKTQ